MSRFDAIDLSRLPPPAVVEVLDAETILVELKAILTEMWPEWSADLESDPTNKLLEIVAYREVLLRQRVNDAARAVMLASAKHTDLDHLAALFHVVRQEVGAGDPDAIPPVAPTYEDDDRLRGRVALAMEGLSTAGPEGAYVFHALSADARIADVAVTSPTPGQVVVTVLSSEGDGVPTADLLAAVETALTDEDVRPLTDAVSVQAGTKIEYQVDAVLDLYDGPDAEVVRQVSERSLVAFTEGQRRLGEPVTFDGLHKAARVDGVRKVTLVEPVTEIEPGATSFARCIGVTVSTGGGA